MLKGNFRIQANGRLIGWAIDEDAPDRTVPLTVEVDGAAAAEVRADLYRPDLADKVRRAHVGFSMDAKALIASAEPVRFTLRDAETGAVLPPGEIVHRPLTAAVGATLKQAAPVGGSLEIVWTRHGFMILNHKDLGVDRELFLYGEYALCETDVMRRFADPARTMLDVGANIGAVALEMARFSTGPGRIVAFEPQRNVYLRLCGNLALNGVTTVHPMNVAVSDRPGVVEVPVIDYTQLHVSGEVGIETGGPGEKVPAVTLDGLDLGPVPVGYVKIDTEGHEEAVIFGARDLVLRDRPAIYFESRLRASCARIFRFLMDAGYTVFWHPAPLFRADNFAGNPVDHYYGSGINANILALPARPTAAVDDLGLVAVRDADEFWPIDRLPAAYADKLRVWHDDV